MSRREGELTVCERCGEQLFVEKEGEIIQDGGFSITSKLKERPKGWELVPGPGGKGYWDVCPKCYERYLILLGGFWGNKERK